MTMVLLVIIAVLALICAVTSVINTLILVKDEKTKEIATRVLKVVCVILLVVSVLAIAFGVSNSKGNSTKENPTTSEISLEDAGFNSVTIDEYLELVKGQDKSIILVARPTCGFCEKFTPVLKQAADEMKLTINYVNTDNFSEDDWTTFRESLDYLSEEEWGTPLTMIVQDGKLVAENNGYVELDTIKNFFADNGFAN